MLLLVLVVGVVRCLCMCDGCIVELSVTHMYGVWCVLWCVGKSVLHQLVQCVFKCQSVLAVWFAYEICGVGV